MKRIIESILEIMITNWIITLPVVLILAVWSIKREWKKSRNKSKRRALNPFTGLQNSKDIF
jgi:hypothetical protein